MFAYENAMRILLLALLVAAGCKRATPPDSTIRVVDSQEPFPAPQGNKLKILLQDHGVGRERVWATDLGPAPRDGRLVQIDSVPLLWEKPTYQDVIVVRPENQVLTWKGGIEKDGGLRGRIFVSWSAGDREAVETQVLGATEQLGGGVEPYRAPSADGPGVLVFALPRAVSSERLLATLRAANPNARFDIVPGDPG